MGDASFVWFVGPVLSSHTLQPPVRPMADHKSTSGLPVIGYATYFYLEAGFSNAHSFDLSTGMHGLAICGAFLSQVLIRYFGRRTLYLWGLFLSFVVLLIAGAIGTCDSQAARWALSSMVVLFIFVFDTTVGPLTYCLVAEIPSTRLRVKTVVFGRVVYNIISIITNVLQTHMLNPLAWNWKGKSCFLWAGTCFLCLVYCYFRLPETAGLTYMELDILFEKRAPARMFRKFQQTLAETGYFSFDADEQRDRWHEPPGQGPIISAK
jgi:SP family general alpha glucoside:H+ symporter-like MFS transporter